eukprot:scaffold1361_cov229-Pinguiococcus_pyrenoidosus.AAC.2
MSSVCGAEVPKTGPAKRLALAGSVAWAREWNEQISDMRPPAGRSRRAPSKSGQAQHLSFSSYAEGRHRSSATPCCPVERHWASVRTSWEKKIVTAWSERDQEIEAPQTLAL